MKKVSVAILCLAVAVLASFATVKFTAPKHETVTVKETTYERILRTHTIRCGYFAYEPALIIDPNTKKMSGIFYDITEEMARRLGLKVEWTEEVGYGEIIQGFETGRYDLFCNVVWPTPERARGASFSIPLYYSLLGVFVRQDDSRFDGHIEKLNDPSVKLAVKDGDITASVAASIFPKASFISIPQMAMTQQQLEEVATGKADATFNEPSLLNSFNNSSDKKLKNIADETPLKYFPSTFIMPKQDFQLKEMLDITLGDMLSDGFIERTLGKYQPSPDSYYRVSKPFQR